MTPTRNTDLSQRKKKEHKWNQQRLTLACRRLVAEQKIKLKESEAAKKHK